MLQRLLLSQSSLLMTTAPDELQPLLEGVGGDGRGGLGLSMSRRLGR